MQLNYNVLWIDNDLPQYEERGEVEKLKEYILNLGFKANMTLLYDEENLENVLSNIRFDLIISDYELDSITGIQVVESIRHKYLTEILFYTAKTSEHTEGELREKLKNIDRITIHLGRDSLMTRIEKIIHLTVSKLLELNATRGVITSETSELDGKIEELVMHLVYNILNIEQAEIDKEINEYVNDFLKKKPDNFLRKYQEKGFKNWFYQIEANRKWQLFRKLLKKINDEEKVATFLEKNKTYLKDVIDVRNKFAHAKSFINNNKLFLAGFGPEGEPFEYDETSCISVRKQLIEHSDSFDELFKHFGL